MNVSKQTKLYTKIFFLFCSFLPFFLMPSIGYAKLQLFRSAKGEKAVVYDDQAKLAWFANMSDSLGKKIYSELITDISKMNASGKEFYGLSGWHLATETELGQLVQNNKLSEIALAFHLYTFQNTSVALGRYENSITPPMPGKHHQFNLTYLRCCEPFNDDLFHYPYNELIKHPGSYDDELYYAHPIPVKGNTENNQRSDTNYSNGGWVVTSKAVLSGDKLIDVTKLRVKVPWWRSGLAQISIFLSISAAGWWYWLRKT